MIELLTVAVRLGYGAFALYGVAVLCTRWRAAKVMTENKRWLFLGLLLEQSNAALAAVLKTIAGAPADVSIYGTLLAQAWLAAYIHYSVPRSYRRAHHVWTRRST